MKDLLLTVTVLLATTIAAFGQDQNDVLFKDGLLAYRSQDLQTALHSFDKVVEAQPGNSRGWLYRGLTRQSLGDKNGAISDMNKAVDLKGDDPNILLRRAEVYMDMGQRYRARTDLSRIVEMVPDGAITIHAWYALGNIYVADDEYQDAVDVYDKIIALQPKDARAWCNRGVAKAHLGDHEGAIADQTKAIEMDQRLANAYASRAIELVLVNRKEEACSDLIKAKELGDTQVDELLVIFCD